VPRVLRSFLFPKALRQRCQSSGRRDHSLEASAVNLNIVRNSSALAEAAINLFDTSHPLLQSYQVRNRHFCPFSTDPSPKGLPEAGFGRKKFRPSVNFCETFPRRPGSNLATTRHASCGTGSSTLCVNQFLYGAGSSVSPRRGPLLTCGRCSR